MDFGYVSVDVDGSRDLSSPTAETQVSSLLQYARQTLRRGRPLSSEPLLQGGLVDAFITGRIGRLLGLRNTWMAEVGEPLTYHEAQLALWERTCAIQLAQLGREILGLYALLDALDPRAPWGGVFERQQRRGFDLQTSVDPTGLEQTAVARGLGLAESRGLVGERAT